MFSVIVSSLLLTIALSVLNTAMKELNFTISARSTGNSLFAADSGIECALGNDKSESTVFAKNNMGIKTINCNRNEINVIGEYPVFGFNVVGLGDDGQSCALVSVLKDPEDSITKVVSKGYNLGGNNNCDQLGLNSTERVIEVNY